MLSSESPSSATLNAIAESNGLGLFNVMMMVAGPGSQRPGAYGLSDANLVTLPWMQPIIDIAGDVGWVLFDLGFSRFKYRQ